MASKKSDHDLITEMHTAMFGVNGHDGLCKQVGEISSKVEKNSRSVVWLWCGLVLVAAGAGGGGYALASNLLPLIGG